MPMVRYAALTCDRTACAELCTMPDAFEELDRGPANYTPLTPLSFLAWAARVYAAKTAVIHGERTFTYAELAARARRLGSALARRGVGRGDTVAIMAPNVP